VFIVHRKESFRYIFVNTTQSLKTEPRIKRENSIGNILCKVHMWKWPVVKDKHTKRRICVLFVFDSDGECKFIKNKALLLLILKTAVYP